MLRNEIKKRILVKYYIDPDLNPNYVLLQEAKRKEKKKKRKEKKKKRKEKEKKKKFGMYSFQYFSNSSTLLEDYLN